MRAAALLVLPLSLLTLTACRPQNVRPPEAYPLSGSVAGDWGQNPHLRLALVGTGLPVAVTNTSTIDQNIVSTGVNTWAFGFDLPTIPSVAGVYQVVVFDDSNNNARFDVGESFARNRQWLVFSPVDANLDAISIPEYLGGAEVLPAMSVKRGWNLYDKAQPLSGANPSPFLKLSTYVLSR
ncbi:hypothetical protein [Deinococcus multiflagellatus]|uniref:Lipoprotein n=1 Tax=Deinococcus multiflagellatus TaxID=1656887 RepID=A0ABW1ZNJ5_9DEIO|nr:hypothetical protein [Deinococcus multiflagellatus]MBZ9712280.1 hypothetical protein [Deinococcus multiflagellatus]